MIRGSPPAAVRAADTEPSVLPSSTTINSQRRSVWDRALSMHAAMNRSWLKHGTTMLTGTGDAGECCGFNGGRLEDLPYRGQRATRAPRDASRVVRRTARSGGTLHRPAGAIGGSISASPERTSPPRAASAQVPAQHAMCVSFRGRVARLASSSRGRPCAPRQRAPRRACRPFRRRRPWPLAAAD